MNANMELHLTRILLIHNVGQNNGIQIDSSNEKEGKDHECPNGEGSSTTVPAAAPPPRPPVLDPMRGTARPPRVGGAERRAHGDAANVSDRGTRGGRNAGWHRSKRVDVGGGSNKGSSTSTKPPSPAFGEVRSVEAGGWGDATIAKDGVDGWGLEGHPVVEGMEVKGIPLKGKMDGRVDGWGSLEGDASTPVGPSNGGWGDSTAVSSSRDAAALKEARRDTHSISPRLKAPAPAAEAEAETVVGSSNKSVDWEAKAEKARLEEIAAYRRRESAVSGEELSRGGVSARAQTQASDKVQSEAKAGVVAQKQQQQQQRSTPEVLKQPLPPSGPPPPLSPHYQGPPPPPTHPPPPSVPPPSPISAAASAYHPTRRMPSPPPGMEAHPSSVQQAADTAAAAARGASGGIAMEATSPSWVPKAGGDIPGAVSLRCLVKIVFSIVGFRFVKPPTLQPISPGV